MTLLRLWLATGLLTLSVYTAITGYNEGWGLFQIFFSDMAKMQWPGQFNLDFLLMLTLSALWTAWRNRFSAMGLALAFLAVVGGFMFLGSYLLILSFRTNGSVTEILLGRPHRE